MKKSLNDQKKIGQMSPCPSVQSNKMNKSRSIKYKGLGASGSLFNSINHQNKKPKVQQLNTSNNKLNSSKIQTPSSKKIKQNQKTFSEKKNLPGSQTQLNKSNYGVKYSDKYNDKQNKVTDDKKRAVPVKNIKQKIIGNKSEYQSTKETLKKIPSKTICQYQMETGNIDQKSSKSKLNQRKKPKQFVLDISYQNTLSLDMFQIGRKLGKGRFGDVYMARDTISGFLLAIKVINKKELKESQMEKQLIQEIKIQMYTNHPNVLKLYNFFADETKIYLLLQLGTNGCLFKQIRTKAYLKQDHASLYFRQVASAIRYLHSHHIIHRDIKPQNILNSFGVLKLCDFGWAAYSPLYQRQTFCGTLDYVPPQIVIGDMYDDKVDVWCLGVLCYQLCTGKAPFESKISENQTYDKILKVDIDFPIYLSGQVVDFISKILHIQPQKRMTMEQFQTHEWMRQYQNQAGRMISKQIWQNWSNLTKK